MRTMNLAFLAMAIMAAVLLFRLGNWPNADHIAPRSGLAGCQQQADC